MPETLADAVRRQDVFFETQPAGTIGPIEKPIPFAALVWGNGAFRKTIILIALAVVWELYARHLNNDLLFPTFFQTLTAFFNETANGTLPRRVWVSLKVLLTGYGIGILIAACITVLALVTRIGEDLLETLTAMFNPLPAIALLPLALIWFGLGTQSIVFVLVHSVLWPVALNANSGFKSVSPTLRMVGKNYGLGLLSTVRQILIPAALPSLITGLKVGWAFAWRTLIAAELVFGVSSGSGGLGWFIFENKNQLEIANVFAGLFTVILIGLAVEGLIFRALEERTVRRWGMQSEISLRRDA
ncbi:binding-protein-dependent transport systems inner membrane component [Rhodomicrobium vannielii ATCC 17100]|uniref:Binding-protein-dependent transport systems inner membrane component n=1 Tax=Rhodomicrobium vannielii (strain ATCC 17100 / DSM 162 / LMG 4299 / NCIMB 10020 / ATH 3.1.1) TaxID=648757 RepID=E3I4S4_RHOVT|nr:ABC transporter permease [Rhodomicrobium vannielii]ADP72746.1 binding-protein-dependent transport systems inner membrane component [Rhodomicrobium vannielii ATCC 17100]